MSYTTTSHFSVLYEKQKNTFASDPQRHNLAKHKMLLVK